MKKMFLKQIGKNEFEVYVDGKLMHKLYNRIILNRYLDQYSKDPKYTVETNWNGGYLVVNW